MMSYSRGKIVRPRIAGELPRVSEQFLPGRYENGVYEGERNVGLKLMSLIMAMLP
jgi:hypothetical protein